MPRAGRGYPVGSLRPKVFTPAAAAAPTGTIAADLQKVAASLTGVMQPQGSIAASLVKAAASLTGAQTQTGTEAATLQPVVASFTGYMRPSGTVAATLLPVAASFTGAMQPVGTIAATLLAAAASLTGTAQPKMGDLADNFDTGIDAKWVASGDNPSEVTTSGGAVRIDHAATAEENMLSSAAAYDLTGSYLYAEIVDRGNQTLVSHEVLFGAWDSPVGGRTNLLTWYMSQNDMFAIYNSGGSQTVVGGVAYDPVAHRWLRIREFGGSIFWDVSAEGLSWSNLFSVANPIALTALYHKLYVRGWQTEASGSYAIFDNVNTTPLTGVAAATLVPVAASFTGAMQPSGTIAAT